MRILRKRIWTWFVSRERMAQEIALRDHLLRMRDMEIEALKRVITLYENRTDSQAWHHAAEGAEAKTVFESLRRPAR